MSEVANSSTSDTSVCGEDVDISWKSDSLDERLQHEFDCLNYQSEVINKLENELDHARSKYRSTLSESSQQMSLLTKKLGKCINKARPYYELLTESRMAQMEAQRAVVQYQRANSMYLDAKETVSMAEERLSASEQEQHSMDPSWQDMLNHATMKFMQSKDEKDQQKDNHLHWAAQCADIGCRLKAMEKDMHRTILRARPYFELKKRLEWQLTQEKHNVEDLLRALQAAKLQYHSAMRNLETISNQVHEQRQHSKLPPRTPGVGAETDKLELPPIDIDYAAHNSDARRGSESASSTGDQIFENNYLQYYEHGPLSAENTPLQQQASETQAQSSIEKVTGPDGMLDVSLHGTSSSIVSEVEPDSGTKSGTSAIQILGAAADSASKTSNAHIKAGKLSAGGQVLSVAEASEGQCTGQIMNEAGRPTLLSEEPCDEQAELCLQVASLSH